MATAVEKAPGAPFTARQQREREFYDEFCRRQPAGEVTFDPVLGRERRPWNAYWLVYELVAGLYTGPEQRLLDFGCGPGHASLRLAKLGFDVHGFDVSPNQIEAASGLAREHGLEERTHFSVQCAEALDYPDEHFDLVVGFDILHHVDVPRAIAECARVLKRTGVAIFREHIAAGWLDRLRNTALVRRLAPKHASLEREISEDERKLDEDDLAAIAAVFPVVRQHRSRLLARADFLSRRLPFVMALERLDQALIARFPALASLCGSVVLDLRKLPVRPD